ncbi:MAG: PLP-dependent aminotransferase family protein [Pseudomonadota bacterium]
MGDTRRGKVSTQANWALDGSRGELTHQLCEQIRGSIQRRELVAGDRIPATRPLAAQLGVARGTVTAAVEMLTAEGVLVARVGAGTFVSADAEHAYTPAETRARAAPVLAHIPGRPDIDEAGEARIDFRPCRPSLESFPFAVWRRCLARAGQSVPSADYGDPRGLAALREAIANYLRRARGLNASADEIIVTNGSVHAMHLLATLCLDHRTTAVFENPGFPLARQVFANTGSRLHLCAVDDDGMQLDQLPDRRRRVGLVYVTPSHQFPVGSRLSLGRRRELIDWVRSRDALLLEDDYDGEYRFDVPPLAPIAVMAPESVVYCGTFSKTMFPGLRIGFAVAPRSVIDAMAARRAMSEYAPNDPLQLALRHFIEDGEYERHILRMRRLYAIKRRLVADTLGAAATLTGIASGLSALIEFDPAIRADDLSRALAEEGILMPPLSRYDVGGANPRNALVCGYAQPTRANIRVGIKRVRALLAT